MPREPSLTLARPAQRAITHLSQTSRSLDGDEEDDEPDGQDSQYQVPHQLTAGPDVVRSLQELLTETKCYKKITRVRYPEFCRVRTRVLFDEWSTDIKTRQISSLT